VTSSGWGHGLISIRRLGWVSQLFSPVGIDMTVQNILGQVYRSAMAKEERDFYLVSLFCVLDIFGL